MSREEGRSSQEEEEEEEEEHVPHLLAPGHAPGCLIWACR
jgi:hypothetical protein